MRTTTGGQPESLNYTTPAAGDYVLVLRAWDDANQDGVPFQFSMKLTQPLDLALPGLIVAVIGLIVLAFGLIRKPAAKAASQYTQAPAEYAQSSAPAGPAGMKYCVNFVGVACPSETLQQVWSRSGLVAVQQSENCDLLASLAHGTFRIPDMLFSARGTTIFEELYWFSVRNAGLR